MKGYVNDILYHVSWDQIVSHRIIGLHHKNSDPVIIYNLRKHTQHTNMHTR